MHKPLSVGYKIVCKDDPKKSKPYKQYVGEDCPEWFVQNVLKEANEIEEIYSSEKTAMKDLTPKEKTKYYDAKECQIWKFGKKFKCFTTFCD